MKRFLNSSGPFIILFLIMSVIYYDSVLDKGPLGIHLWRQTDCLSMTQHYMEGGSFAEPEMHIQLADDLQSGHSAGEFPILYYGIGNIWKITGQSHFVYRFIYLLILFAGLFALHKSLRLVIKDNFWSTTLPILIYASPVFVVYGVSFLTDVPAFCFVLTGIYYFTKYHLEERKKLLMTALLFIALAGLIKVSSLILFVGLGAVFLLEQFGVRTLGDKQLFKRTKFEWLMMASVLIIVFAWYSYASWFNDQHGFKYTFNNTYPLWRMSSKELHHWWVGVRDFASYLFFHRSVYYIIIIGFIFNLFLIKRIPILGTLSNLLGMIGVIAYFILWAPLMRNHDYYYVPALILILTTFVPLFWWVSKKIEGNKGLIVRCLFGLMLLWNLIYCVQIVKLKTLAVEGEFSFVQNKELVEELTWINQHGNSKFKSMTEMQDMLEENGVEKSDKVISLPDPSFNVSLYFIQRKGWTNFANYTSEEEIDGLVDAGAKYLVISSPEVKEWNFIQSYLSDSLCSFNGVEVYTLKDN